MLFADPDFPVFLIAVFFMYALARQRTLFGRYARNALLVLLGDLVFLLIAKDPDALWDPVGGVLYRLVTGGGNSPMWEEWPPRILLQWAIGGALLFGAVQLGRRADGLITVRGQQWLARGMMTTLVVLGACVAVTAHTGTLDEMTAGLAAHGHLLVLFALGLAIGASEVTSLRPLGRLLVLFVASSLFYHAWAAAMLGAYRYLLALLLFTIVLDYFLALWIEQAQSAVARKLLVIGSVVSNLGILFFFKYTDFVTQDVLHLSVERLDLILPAGISFHTFQSLSYTIDVYRKKLPATRSVLEFATFVLFFPQLVAGPIVRAQDLVPQLQQLPALELDKATRGLFLIVVGLFKKIALADTLGLTIVDRVFQAPQGYSSVEVLCAVYGYALQIYLDFSAYSDIAIGAALILGFTLPENFRTPYRSANIQEFWRRWHMSLSSWLRDYLYIALGGNRGAQWRTYLNLILTMLIGGLWHGPSWAFVVWGGLHGFGLAITRFFQRVAQDGNRQAAAWLLAGCAVLVAVGFTIQRTLIPSDASTWAQLAVAWLYLTPLWAVATAWLGRDTPDREADRSPARPWRELDRTTWIPEALRLAMCVSAVVFLAALQWWQQWTWIPLAAVTWTCALAADIVERGRRDLGPRALAVTRRALAVFLVFHYVCLAWIFFRVGLSPTSFDDALLILQRLAAAELDHANVVPIVTTALVVGMLCHCFAEGSFRWLRDRFTSLPVWAQGSVLAACALVLRELAHPKVVPFIYFQF